MTAKTAWSRLLGLVLLGTAVSASALAAGWPKLLVFDGVNIRKQTTEVQGRYWGQEVGVQGSFKRLILAEEGPSCAVTADPAAIIREANRTREAFVHRHDLSENSPLRRACGLSVTPTPINRPA